MSDPSSHTLNGKAKKEKKDKDPHRLILCFDGTGNKFSGNSGDTNIVKLYQMCDRGAKGQYHYYQPGIGTYSASEGSLNAGIFGSIQRWFSQTIDQGVGTTFDHHVIAGYRFLMRYYKPGDKIYIFGFSRGAFTARFLARLVTEIGLLSKGNEEMVPFAYRTYQDYETGGRAGNFKSLSECRKYMDSFKETFCRLGVEIHFLGLFDTVNSVGFFEIPFVRKTYLPVYAPAAAHIRHAVSIDERRLKFKPALFSHDEEFTILDSVKPSDIKEVFFAGNHADIGGGWETKDEQDVQLSDITLEWMLKEIEALPCAPNEKVCFNNKHKQFLENVDQKREMAITKSPTHDALSFGKGKGWAWPSVICWWIFEVLPFFKRLEFEGGKWVSQYWPPNLGFTRDLPTCAILHPSVIERVKAEGTNYNPKNLGFSEAFNEMSMGSNGDHAGHAPHHV